MAKQKFMRLTARDLGLHVELSDDEPEAEGENQFVGTFMVGDKEYLGIHFPTEELKKAADTMKGQPVNLDHSFSVEDEVGFVSNPTMFDDALKGVVNLSPETKEFSTAKAFIANRRASGRVAEVSVGVFLDIEEEETENGGSLLVARNLRFDHLSLVVRGACGPGDGCGIDMSDRMTETNDDCGCSDIEELESVYEETQGKLDVAEEELEAIKAEFEVSQEAVEKLEKERDELQARLDEYESEHLENMKAEAEELGVSFDDDVDAEELEMKLEVAREIVENGKPKRHSKTSTKPKHRSEKLLEELGLSD